MKSKEVDSLCNETRPVSSRDSQPMNPTLEDGGKHQILQE